MDCKNCWHFYNCRKYSELESCGVVVREQDVCGQNSQRDVGARINIEAEDVAGRSGSLMKSLIASAIGWSRPYGPTTFGPFRNCM